MHFNYANLVAFMDTVYSFFFGTMVNDPFVSGMLQLFTFAFWASLLYGAIFLPARWAIRAIIRKIKGA